MGDDDTERVEAKNLFDKSLKEYYERSSGASRRLADQEASERLRTQVSTEATVQIMKIGDDSTIGSQEKKKVVIDEGKGSQHSPGNSRVPPNLELSVNIENSNTDSLQSNYHSIHLTPRSSPSGSLPATPSIQGSVVDFDISKIDEVWFLFLI
jgi:hypothetical protein